MTSNDFCNWLKGYLDLTNKPSISAKQKEIIQKHLALVFAYEIDPSYGSEEVQKQLNEIHHPLEPAFNASKKVRRC